MNKFENFMIKWYWWVLGAYNLINLSIFLFLVLIPALMVVSNNIFMDYHWKFIIWLSIYIISGLMLAGYYGHLKDRN